MMGYGRGIAQTGCGFLPLLIGILIIGFLFLYLKKGGNGGKEPLEMRSNPQAMEQLNNRLAKGEITLEEYQTIKNILLK
jgi:uncharacterized membrane protein